MATGEVWCVTPSASGGWAPITALAELTGRVWGSTPRFIHPTAPYGRVRKSLSLLPRRRRGGRSLLLIAAQPGDLLALARPEVLAGRFDQVGAWIIDSFWDERIPLFARRRPHFDALWVTDAELTDTYTRATGVRSGWLSWGTDALRAPTRAADSAVDVLRLGRQPAAWDDDRANRDALAEHGLSYQGRFPVLADAAASQAAVMRQLARSRAVLASSSLASPSDYSHPSRDYISARFTDAVACGTRIAGTRPRCRAADLIPPQAWIELPPAPPTEGARVLAAALASDDSGTAQTLRRSALEHLDWRHRLAVVTRDLDVDAPLLTTELAEIDRLLSVEAA